jgi:hypothetical protein
MTYSEHLEQETEQTRAAFERTLEELRARISPGQLVDQLTEYARGGPAAAFLRNLGQRTVDNPLPLVVIGAGLAWLIVANGRATRGESSGPSAEAIAETARSTAARAGDLAHRAKSHFLGDRSEPQLGQTEARRSGLLDFIQGHPVVLVGLGLAIGAAISAAVTPLGLRWHEADADDAKERIGQMGEIDSTATEGDDLAKARVAEMGEPARDDRAEDPRSGGAAAL